MWSLSQLHAIARWPRLLEHRHLREIIEPERIVCTDSFSDSEGNVIPASNYGMSGEWPLELLLTVTFEEYEGKTMMTLQHVGIPAGENRDLTEAGWNESFDKLAEYLEKVEVGKN